MNDQTPPPPAPPPAPKMTIVLTRESMGKLAGYLMTHHREEIFARFPDGEGDMTLFAAELLARLEGRSL